MGNCSPTRLESYAYFNVYNVDAKLFKHSKGQIRITSDKMVLFQKDTNNKIEWPLNGVRRYGFYKDIFLFECGRRCPTGEGLFAFKCSKAKRLNDAVHKAVSRNAVEPADTVAPQQTASASNNSQHRNSASTGTHLMANVESTHRSHELKSKSLTTETNNANNTSRSSYYVNGSLICLPPSISFVNQQSNGANNSQSAKASFSDIDPAILHITNSFNSNSNPGRKPHKQSHRANNVDRTISRELNYVSAQIIARSNMAGDDLNEQQQQQQQNLQKQEQTDQKQQQPQQQQEAEKRPFDADNQQQQTNLMSSAAKSKEAEAAAAAAAAQIEYTTINPIKTQAIQAVKSVNEKKHMEYVALGLINNNNNNNSS